MTYARDPVIAYFYAAALLAPAAFIFDVMDGRVARARQQHSALGRELDSLADVISFGVMPAALAFAAGMTGGWDWIALMYFVCCGVSRLARYNVTAEAMSKDTGKVTYFEGTPIPTSVVLVGVLAFAAWQGRLGANLYGGAWTLGPWTLHPAGAALCAVGHADDQQDAAHPQALGQQKRTRRAGAFPSEVFTSAIHQRRAVEIHAVLRNHAQPGIPRAQRVGRTCRRRRRRRSTAHRLPMLACVVDHLRRRDRPLACRWLVVSSTSGTP
jgi:CDP-diacylglycerol--serine O-phosphatidyltransferase